MIGQQVSHYRILELIGSGASGSVYKAEHATLGINVALKFIHTDNLIDPGNRARFAHEARAAATLDHTSICKVFDFEEFERTAFIAMDFIEGESLKDLIKRGPIPLRDAVLITIQIAEGLEQAHGRGIIHRDIKPSNIMIRRRKEGRIQAKILDFGVARTIDTTRLTTTGTVLGTSTYMSPEQIHGHDVDHRSDLWSLGVVLYEMLTGSPPFSGDHHLAVQFSIVHTQPEPARKLCSEIPPDLNDFINRSIKKNPDARFQSTGEMLSELRAFLNAAKGVRNPLHDWLWKYRNRLALGTGGLLTLALLGMIVPQLIPRSTPVPNPFERGRTRRIVHSDACQSQPRLSPDGSRVIFTSDEGGDKEITWVGLSGGDPVALTDHPADDYDPCWLPDGTGFLFVSERPEGRGIWKNDLSGTAPRFIIEGGLNPSVSPDGLRVAYAKADSSGQARIFVADLADPTQETQVSDDGQGYWLHSYPAWSPDGKSIAYGSYHNLWLVSLVDGTARQVTEGGTADLLPVFSKDGRFLYFSSMRDGPSSLWRVDLETGDMMKMTPGSGPEYHSDIDRSGTKLVYSTQFQDDNIVLVDRLTGRKSYIDGPQRDLMPSLSPDGSLMVFVSRRWNRGSDLWLQHLEDGVPVDEPQRIVDQEGTVSMPAVSPDGKWVAYYLINQETKERDLWIAPLPGGLPTRITRHPAGEMSPDWAPDGKALAFSSDREGFQGVYTIAVEQGRATGTARLITPPGLMTYFPAWSPDGNLIAFKAVEDGAENTMVVPADGSEAPRRLTSGADIYAGRWIWDSQELWVSGNWGGEGNEVRRVVPGGETPQPLDPPLLLDPNNEMLLFSPDRSGRFVAFTEVDVKGDIWLLEADGDVRF